MGHSSHDKLTTCYIGPERSGQIDPSGQIDQIDGIIQRIWSTIIEF